MAKETSYSNATITGRMGSTCEVQLYIINLLHQVSMKYNDSMQLIQKAEQLAQQVYFFIVQARIKINLDQAE